MTTTILILGWLIGSAQAKPAPRTGVVYTHAGTAPKDVADFAEYIARSLETEGSLSPEQLRKLIETRFSRTAATVARGDRAAVVKQLREDYRAARNKFIQGEYAAAQRSLASVEKRMLDQSPLLIGYADLRADYRRALLYHAHACMRAKLLKQTDMLLAQVVLSFPRQKVSAAEFAPELVKAYDKIRTRLEGLPRAAVRVSGARPGAKVYLNERAVGTIPAAIENIAPGTYRLYVEGSRVHTVTVAAGENAIVIDGGLDRSLRTVGQVALAYANQAEQQKWLARHLAKLAQATGIQRWLVLAAGQDAGKRVLVGRNYDARRKGAPRMGASQRIALEPERPAPAALDKFARAALASDPEPPPLRLMHSGSWKLLSVSGGIGLGAIAAGAVLLAIDGDGTCDQVNCPERYNTSGLGIGLLVGGGAILTTGIVLYVLQRNAEKSRVAVAPVISRGRAGVAVIGRF